MTAIIRPRPWAQQPQFVTGIDRSNVFGAAVSEAWAFANLASAVSGESVIKNGATHGAGAAGRSLDTLAGGATSAIQLLADSSKLPTDQCSVVYVCQKPGSDSIADGHVSFAVGAPGGTTAELHAYIPYLDGNVYWRYGNGSGISVAQSVGTELNTWGFSAGSKYGRQIWRNGAVVASDATLITRSASSAAFVLGTTEANAQPLQKRYLLLVLNKQFDQSMFKALLANPWQVFRPRVT